MKILLYSIFLLLLTKCASLQSPSESQLPGRYYKIKPGDNLSTISKNYRVSIDEIMEINGISDTRLLKPGREIFLPDPDPIGTKVKILSENQPKVLAKKEDKNIKQILDFPLVNGKIFREFSRSKQNPYDGIAISAPKGTPILAAQKGRVLFVGDDGTRYGLIIILEHEPSLITVYTHLDKSLVKADQIIARHTPIGTVGNSGGVEKAHLHFQVRLNQRPENPRNYLRAVTSK